MARGRRKVLTPISAAEWAAAMRLVMIILTLTLSLIAGPLASEAQQAAKVYRVGVLVWGDCPARDTPYLQALRELGYVEGGNLTLTCRTAQRRYDALATAARELVQAGVDVIAALNHPAARAAREATSSVPIVMVASGDPVAAGLVASLGRPGGNVTGLTYYATELTAKRLELLKEAVPGLTRLGVLHNPALAYLPFLDDTHAAAKRFGVGLQIAAVSEHDDLNRAFQTFARTGVQAVFILPDLWLSAEARQIAELALRHRLPTMSWGSWFAHAGCLITYSGDYRNMFKRAALFTDRILKGTKPADLPVEQPTKFELVINMKTAKALGHTIPQSLLLRADQVIE
jgi:putative tryptophan/tyrosine transport system substrate-binding protein